MPKAKATNHFFKTLNAKTMQTKKMSLDAMQGKLSRAEMKKIMGGCGTENLCIVTYTNAVMQCHPDNNYDTCMGNAWNNYLQCYLNQCGEQPY